MKLYCLSSFNDIYNLGEKSVYKNTITKRSVYINNKSLDFINKNILIQQISSLEDNDSLRLFQIIASELLYRGIIVPIDEIETEENYLNSIILLENQHSSFFNCTNLSEYKIDSLDIENQNIIFCGIPSDLGAKNPGTRFGSNLLRNRSSSLLFRSSKKNPCLLDISNQNKDIFSFKNIYDVGDINLKHLSEKDSLEKVKDISYTISKKGIPFFIGGDHLFTLSTVEGLYEARKNPFTLVQFDYHLDIQIWGQFKDNKPKILTTPTHANFVSWIHNKMPSIKIVQLGVDNYQSTEKENLRNVTNYINNIGSRISNIDIIKNPISQTIEKLPKNQEIYISIDVDVLNFIYMNATGYPSSVGISFEHLLIILSELCKRNKIIGVDVMEFGKNNKADSHFDMSTLVVNLILEILKNLN